jgi:hypothetical protein
MRARTHIEDLEKGNRQAIIVDEIPYQVNKANLLIRIGELVREKKLDGISDLRDESDKSGMRVVIELKRGELPEIVVNNLYKLTQLQDSFGMNMVALVDGQPRLLSQAVPRVFPSTAGSRRAARAVRAAQGRALQALEGRRALSNVTETEQSPPRRARGVGQHRLRFAVEESRRARPMRGTEVGCLRVWVARERSRATGSPTHRRRRSSSFGCSGSPASSRTRSSANTRR